MKNNKHFEWNKVTPLSKYLAMALFIALPFIGFMLGMKYQQKIGIVNLLSTTQVKKSEIQQNSLCNFTPNLPKGYYFQDPINSFYGYTHKKSDAAQICKIILGPNYKNGNEGFSGEQIQINAYPINKTSLDELSPLQTTNIKINKNVNGYRFERDGYGGKNEVIVFQQGNQFYQIIWRNQPNDLENIVKNISAQL